MGREREKNPICWRTRFASFSNGHYFRLMTLTTETVTVRPASCDETRRRRGGGEKKSTERKRPALRVHCCSTSLRRRKEKKKRKKGASERLGAPTGYPFPQPLRPFRRKEGREVGRIWLAERLRQAAQCPDVFRPVWGRWEGGGRKPSEQRSGGAAQPVPFPLRSHTERGEGMFGARKGSRQVTLTAAGISSMESSAPRFKEKKENREKKNGVTLSAAGNSARPNGSARHRSPS